MRKMQSDADFRNMDIKVLVALHVSLKSQPISYVPWRVTGNTVNYLSGSMCDKHYLPGY